MVVLGIDIGGTMIKTALISQNEVSFKKRFPTPSDKEQFQRLLSQMIRDYQEIQSFHKIAFSVPGSVDQSGTVRFGGAVPYLDQLQLQSFLELENFEVFVENDAKAATSCEMKYGNLKGIQ